MPIYYTFMGFFLYKVEMLYLSKFFSDDNAYDITVVKWLGKKSRSREIQDLNCF